MAYFRCVSLNNGTGATITVSYESDVYGQTITCTDGTTTLTKTAASTGSVVFNIPNAGTWTVSVTINGVTYSEQIEVVTEYSCTLSLGLDYVTWLSYTDLDPTDYSSLAEVLADEEAVRELMTRHASVDYLATAQEGDEMMETIINNDLCAKWINLRDYALDTLYANEAIADVMDEADKYFYGEWVITDNTTTPPTWGAKGNVPTMTSNTAPYGEASASTTYTGNDAYKAFDGDSATYWAALNQATNQRVIYKSVNPICVKKAKGLPMFSDSMKIQGSNDGTTWVDLCDATSVTANQEFEIDLSSNNNFYLYHCYLVIQSGNSSNSALYTLQFYGREMTVSVPTMTSNTAPYGEAFTDYVRNNDNSQYGAWRSFAGFNDDNQSNVWTTLQKPSPMYPAHIGYSFNSKIVVKMIMLGSYTYNSGLYARSIKGFKLQGSNDKTNWVDVGEQGTKPYGTYKSYFDYSDNDTPYKHYRVEVVDDWGAGYIELTNLNFFGFDYSERDWDTEHPMHYIYDHGVELEEITDQYTPISGFTLIKGTRQSDELEMHTTEDYRQCGFVTVNTIDLSDYNYFFARVKQARLGTWPVILYASTNQVAYPSSAIIAQLGQNIPYSDIRLCLDISAVSQSVYLRLDSSNGRWANVNEWWLE